MARNYVWLESDTGPIVLDAGEVVLVAPSDEGRSAVSLLGDTAYGFAVHGTVAEVAAKLGIRPAGAGEAAAPEEEVERFARAINRQLGWCWVGGPGVPARFLVSTWHRGFARLFDDEVEPGPELWDGCKPDSTFDPDNIGGDRICRDIARWLWSLGYREVVDAPEAETKPEPEPPIPSRDEQSDMLAGGKRLRFERDGRLGERVPEAVEAIVHGGLKDEDGDERYHGYVGRPGSELEVSPLFQSEWGIHRVTTARRTLELLSDLGYRFVAVVD